jgi:hypothetical protein
VIVPPIVFDVDDITTHRIDRRSSIAVNLSRSVVKQQAPIIRWQVPGHFFERIPQNSIGPGFPVHRKITLEHAARCAKLLYTVQIVTRRLVDQLIG